MQDPVLTLFDIDGTLMHTHGAGRRAFERTVRNILGRDDDIAYINFAGNTDLNVLEEVVAVHGDPWSDTLAERFFEQLAEELRACIGEAALEIYPGVRELLKALEEQPDMLLGLVTGNTEACARIKLEQFGIHGHFLLGAFGHEHADRNRIAALAVERARRTLNPGRTFRGIYLIGDTPSDIRAAKAVGACSVAVATGAHSASELHDAGADIVLDDLSDTAGVLRLLRGGLDP